MAIAIFDIEIETFRQKALNWANQFDDVCYFQSNGFRDEYSNIDAFLAVQAKYAFEPFQQGKVFEELVIFRAKHPNKWMPGFFSYDLKSETENVTSRFDNPLGFPEAYFFIPETTIQFWDEKVEIESDNPHEVFTKILQQSSVINSMQNKSLLVQSKMSKEDYVNAFNSMQAHIKRGDIYEVNLCQEFFAHDVEINPLSLYKKLNHISPTPFSCFFKYGSKFILSASPERFLAKRANQLISQPIKGTAPRGKSPQ